jgi:peptidoglycan/xylan/chitin deacetylase (PgdA/CDA1 family)
MKITPRLALKLGRDFVQRALRRRRERHGIVLMYHRVAVSAADPWNLCVSPANFAGHLRELSAWADVVPLHALPSSLRAAGRRTRPVVAITFDDAYLDTLTAAKPALTAQGAAATVFVPTGWVGRPEPVWWDLLAHMVLANRRLPDRVDIDEAELKVSWRRPATERLHQVLWSQLRAMGDDARRAAMQMLATRLQADPEELRDVRVMTADELDTLTADGLVSLGSHAVSHPSLPLLTRADKAWEIDTSTRQFQQLTGRRPATFAYPYGDLDDESVGLVAEAGYALACATHEDLVWPDAHPLRLPRLAVGNWSPRQFRLRLTRYWLA